MNWSVLGRFTVVMGLALFLWTVLFWLFTGLAGWQRGSGFAERKGHNAPNQERPQDIRDIPL